MSRPQSFDREPNFGAFWKLLGWGAVVISAIVAYFMLAGCTAPTERDLTIEYLKAAQAAAEAGAPLLPPGGGRELLDAAGYLAAALGGAFAGWKAKGRGNGAPPPPTLP